MQYLSEIENVILEPLGTLQITQTERGHIEAGIQYRQHIFDFAQAGNIQGLQVVYNADVEKFFTITVNDLSFLPDLAVEIEQNFLLVTVLLPTLL